MHLTRSLTSVPLAHVFLLQLSVFASCFFSRRYRYPCHDCHEMKEIDNTEKTNITRFCLDAL